MAYSIELAKSIAKTLERIPAKQQRAIVEAIDGLKHNPRPSGTKKLKGEDGVYRIRVGEYRILYEIEDKRLIIFILKVGGRKDIYRQFW